MDPKDGRPHTCLSVYRVRTASTDVYSSAYSGYVGGEGVVVIVVAEFYSHLHDLPIIILRENTEMGQDESKN